MAEYPIFTTEDTVLKETVRGNPGILLIENGRIKWKSTLTAIDSRRLDGGAEEASGNPADLRPELGDQIWKRLCLWYPVTMGALILASLILVIRKSLRQGSQAHRRRAPQEDCSPSQPSEKA